MAAQSEPIHTVEPGDTLSNLAARLQGKMEDWPQLWRLNDFISNPNLIYPGQRLRLAAGAKPTPARLRSQLAEALAPEHLPPTLVKQVFLSEQAIQPLGTVAHAEVDRLLLHRDDVLFVAWQPSLPWPAVGLPLSIVRLLRHVRHPSSGAQLGWLLELAGQAQVQSIAAPWVRVKLDSSSRDVERGLLVVGQVANVLAHVDVVPATHAVTATVVAFAGDGMTAHEQELVFVDQGSNAGLQPGNLLQMQATSDPVHPAALPLDGDVVARLQVLDVQAHTATAVLLESAQELSLGCQVSTVLATDHVLP